MIHFKTQTAAQAKGQRAERLALSYLQKQGLILREQNFTVKGGEIDLIMQEDNTLVFVEVKARYPGSLVHPFESITPAKCKSIQLAAQIYLVRKRAHHFYLRFDVIGVNLHNDEIEWLKNAF
jgi:putative endonuclease